MESSRRFLVLLFVAAMPLLGRAQEQYKSVETTELLKVPQKYWARPIVFKDTLTEPPKDARVDIEGKRYAAFSTREIGICYAAADLLPAMSHLEVNREYLFSGTVFQNRGRYVPVIQSYTSAMDTRKLSMDIQTVAEETPESFSNPSVRPMADLLAAVQSAQVAYAKEKNIPLCQLYDPTSEHFVKAMDIARTAIYNSEQKNNTASAEILAQYLSTVLAKQCVPASTTQTVIEMESAPPSENQKPPAQVEKAPKPPPTNTTLKKLSWSERRVQAQAKKDAERKAKKERETARAAEKAVAEYEAQQKEAPATDIAPVAASSGQKAASPSWFQRWKIERQKRAVIKAELRRIEQAKKEEELKKKRKTKAVAAQEPPAATTQPSTAKPANGNGIYLPVSR